MIWRWAFQKDVTTVYTEPQVRRVPGRYKKKQGRQCIWSGEREREIVRQGVCEKVEDHIKGSL